MQEQLYQSQQQAWKELHVYQLSTGISTRHMAALLYYADDNNYWTTNQPTKLIQNDQCLYTTSHQTISLKNCEDVGMQKMYGNKEVMEETQELLDYNY